MGGKRAIKGVQATPTADPPRSSYSHFSGVLYSSVQPVDSVSHSGAIVSYKEQLNEAYPSRADTPMTSKLARRSRLASASTTSAALASELGPGAAASSSSFPGRARCQASNDSRISATVRDESLSCLLAKRSRGRFSNRGEVMTSSGRVSTGWTTMGVLWPQKK